MVAITQEIEEFLESPHGRVIMRLSASQLFLKQPKKTTEMIDDFIELSAEQKQALINAQSGEGFLVVEDNEVPVYVVCSPEEHRIFNTDPEKEASYSQKERQDLARARRLGTETEAPLDAPSGGRGHGEGDETFDPLEERSSPASGTQSPAPGTTRRITHHGRARRLLASGDEEDFVPAPDDYETVALPERGPARPGSDARAEREFATSGVPEGADRDFLTLPVADAGQGPVIAVSGEGAGLVAYNLAALLAAANKPAGDDPTGAAARSVLFVDAEGEMSRALFGEDGHVKPDDLLVLGEKRDFEQYTAYDPTVNLRLLVHPGSPHAPAHALIDLTLQYFDAVIVACGESSYATDWLSRSTVALASGASQEVLQRNVARSEELRGRDGTLLAALGPVRLSPRLLSRPVLPATGPGVRGARRFPALRRLRLPWLR